MYFNKHIGISGYRDLDEIIQAHDRIYSDDLETAQLGCEQIFAWLSKVPRSQPFFEITAVIRSTLIQNSKSPLEINKLKSYFQSFKILTNRIISEFPSDYENYQYLSQCAFCDDEYFPPKDELLNFSSSLLSYLNETFWNPNIQIYKKRIEDITSSISEYFENEETFNLSKNNFLMFFTPLLAKEFCKYDKEEKRDELIFGFTRSELLTKFPNFITKAIDFTDHFFAESFAFEFSDYLIQGSEWASKVLDMIIKNKICDSKAIYNYILCAPEKKQAAIDFLQSHNIHIDEPGDNFWYGTQMGKAPYQYEQISIENVDLDSHLEVESTLVGFLREERKNDNTYNKNCYPNNDKLAISFKPKKLTDQDKNSKNNHDNNIQETNKNSNTNDNKSVIILIPSRKITDQAPKPTSTQTNNKTSNTNSTKPVISTEKPKDKKLIISIPHKK